MSLFAKHLKLQSHRVRPRHSFEHVDVLLRIPLAILLVMLEMLGKPFADEPDRLKPWVLVCFWYCCWYCWYVLIVAKLQGQTAEQLPWHLLAKFSGQLRSQSLHVWRLRMPLGMLPVTLATPGRIANRQATGNLSALVEPVSPEMQKGSQALLVNSPPYLTVMEDKRHMFWKQETISASIYLSIYLSVCLSVCLSV